MRNLLLRCAVGLGLDRPVAWMMRRKPVILMYHGFRAAGSTPDPLDYYGDKLPADRFQEQARWLKKNRKVMPVGELVDRLATGRPIPDYATAITIDDGYRSVYDHAYPILREEGVPATVFVAADFIDKRAPLWTDRVQWAHARSRKDLGSPEQRKRTAHALAERLKKETSAERRRDLSIMEAGLGETLSLDSAPDSYQPLTWEQLREMADSGYVEVGSHSRTHPIVARCEPLEKDEEILGSKLLIEERMGRSCSLFCYPNGDVGDFDASTRVLLQKAKYACGLTTVPGFVSATDDPYALPRFGTSDEDTLADFVMTFSIGRHVKRRLMRALGGA